MYDKMFKDVVKNAPFGYAYHEIILDEQGKCVDFVYLDANEAFEKMTGLEMDKVIGKPASEVVPAIKKDTFDWLQFYEDVCLKGEQKEIVELSPYLGRWYKINAFSPEENRFVAYFYEMTEEMQLIERLQEQKKKISDLVFQQRMIDDTTHDAMFMAEYKQGEYYYISTNKAHAELTGYKQEDVAGRTPTSILGEEMAATVVRGYDECVLHKGKVVYEDTLDFPTGRKTFKTNLVPIMEDGEVRYIIGSRQDITEQRRVEREKNELFERLQTMYTGHLAVMLNINPFTGKIVDANPAACEFYGYDMNELLTMNIQDINMLENNDIATFRKEVVNGEKNYFIFPHRMKNGEIRLVDVYSSMIINKGRKELYSIIFDATEREVYKEQLFAEKELLRTTFLSIGDGVITTDAEGCIKMMNAVAEEITGWHISEVKGKPFSQVFKLISEVTGEAIEDPVAKVLRSGKTIGLANHTALINKYDMEIPIADSAAPIRNNEDIITGVVMVFRDVTVEKAHEEQIMYLSYHDALTGLYNRRYLDEKQSSLDVEENLPIAVIMGDVNGLKLTNDIFGHEVGDRLLIKAANVLKACSREGDLVARWGGDEFIIVLPNADCHVADEMVKKIRKMCAEDNEDNLNLSIALGWAAKTDTDLDMQKLYKDAEEFMYQVKLTEGKSYRKNSIDSLMTTLYEKSEETEEHTQRLRTHCLAMGKEMKLSARKMGELELLAKLHDIGKVAISENVLNKRGPLTDAEWIEMKKHPEIGFRITQNIAELSMVTEYILYHHERWDGMGYPRGLKGDHIPLLSRILAVADAYDAMTNDRVYRKGMPKEKAIEEIKRNAGIQFDPEMVELFLKVV